MSFGIMEIQAETSLDILSDDYELGFGMPLFRCLRSATDVWFILNSINVETPELRRMSKFLQLDLVRVLPWENRRSDDIFVEIYAKNGISSSQLQTSLSDYLQASLAHLKLVARDSLLQIAR